MTHLANRLCPRLVQAALDTPFVHALQTGDADLLGVLAQHPRTMELLDLLGPAALMYTVLPVWRRHRMARTDWSVDDQAYALQALMAGFVGAATQTPHGVTVEAPDKVMAAAVTALLGPDQAGPADVNAAAEEGVRFLRGRRAAVLALVTTKQENK